MSQRVPSQRAILAFTRWRLVVDVILVTAIVVAVGGNVVTSRRVLTVSNQNKAILKAMASGTTVAQQITDQILGAGTTQHQQIIDATQCLLKTHATPCATRVTTVTVTVTAPPKVITVPSPVPVPTIVIVPATRTSPNPSPVANPSVAIILPSPSTVAPSPLPSPSPSPPCLNLLRLGCP